MFASLKSILESSLAMPAWLRLINLLLSYTEVVPNAIRPKHSINSLETKTLVFRQEPSFFLSVHPFTFLLT